MKATGIIRRIDDLGRIVLPKETRRMLKIHEGDPLELYATDDGCVLFKKYNPLGFDPTMVATVFRSVLKTSNTIPQMLLVSGHEVMADSKLSEPKMVSEDVRDIGECRVATACAIEAVDVAVSFAGSHSSFQVAHIRHIFGGDGEYVASCLIAPGVLSDIDAAIIQTLATVIAAMCA